MRNKVIIGGIIALAIVVLTALACFWIGKKFSDGIKNNDNATTENQVPEGQKPSPPV